MSKNIVVLCDGTSNEISADRTNILRLFGTLERSDRQIVYYDPGVGTFGADESWSSLWRDATEVFGMATGWGLDHNVKEAYRFLVENYDAGPLEKKTHPDRDRIYIFGFSRGAYTARVLAGFIHAFGLMSRHHLNLLDYAYRTYKDIPNQGEEGPAPPAAFARMRLFERALANDRPPIRLLGLFDTVASMIESGNRRIQFKTHPFTNKNESVEYVRHAVAIDERRTMFRPELWTPGQDYRGNPFAPVQGRQDLKEVWFAGVHGDVGGGYPEAESALIKVPLDWMIKQTRPTGLLYKTAAINSVVLGKDKNKDYVRPSAQGPIHDSMNAGWQILEHLPRRAPPTSWRRDGQGGGLYLPRSDPRFIPPGALLHQSVLDRRASLPPAGSYDPVNLPAVHSVEPW